MKMLQTQRHEYTTPMVVIQQLEQKDVLSFSFEINGYDVFDDGFNPNNI